MSVEVTLGFGGEGAEGAGEAGMGVNLCTWDVGVDNSVDIDVGTVVSGGGDIGSIMARTD